MCDNAVTVFLLLFLVASCAAQADSRKSMNRARKSASSQRKVKVEAATFSLPSPVSEEEAVELRMFGPYLAHVGGAELLLRRDDGTEMQRRLTALPSRPEGVGGSLSELRWSVCGAAGVDTVSVQVLWKPETAENQRWIFCRIGSTPVLISAGGEWDVRLGRLEYRRLPWSPDGGELGPSAVAVRSGDRTPAVACLKLQCMDDGELDSLSTDDVTCQEFTDCAVFDIPQGRPSYLFVRPGPTTSSQIGKPLRVQFQTGPAPPEWSISSAPSLDEEEAECRRRQWGVNVTEGEEEGGRREELEDEEWGQDDAAENPVEQELDRMEGEGSIEDGRIIDDGGLIKDRGNISDGEIMDDGDSSEGVERRLEEEGRRRGDWNGNESGMGREDVSEETAVTQPKGPVRVRVKTTVTLYRPRQTSPSSGGLTERPQQRQGETELRQGEAGLKGEKKYEQDSERKQRPENWKDGDDYEYDHGDDIDDDDKMPSDAGTGAVTAKEADAVKSKGAGSSSGGPSTVPCGRLCSVVVMVSLTAGLKVLL
ncbi:uncharacterized protein LOC122368606 isoform X2 [Amphibalanus amphitrite]|uniref:uncharacterized protein LOC122368606 isoform X2 n=1 Tax=Amphibalanus amphitrite TaxID=1232801 RepID=UPI001C9093A9|nr:uncharacterized protein LOC122368606 isoform X2 [Amphibalanus amphitrite]